MYQGSLPGGGSKEAKQTQKEPGRTRELVAPGLWGGGGDMGSGWVSGGEARLKPALRAGLRSHWTQQCCRSCSVFGREGYTRLLKTRSLYSQNVGSKKKQK